MKICFKKLELNSVKPKIAFALLAPSPISYLQYVCVRICVHVGVFTFPTFGFLDKHPHTHKTQLKYTDSVLACQSSFGRQWATVRQPFVTCSRLAVLTEQCRSQPETLKVAPWSA